MSTIKTAISLEASLFEQVETVAQEMQISRSRFFVLAAQAFIRQHENQQMLADLNRAYSDQPDEEEAALLHQMRAKQFQLVADEW
ncbi:MAG: CopG family transcriptional regulator [Ardenticatenaceae bacterium]|nr:CopG family transcriptional regulator [Ardenticatenaceae bacterium]